MTKNEWRKRFRSKRHALSLSEVERLSLEILHQLTTVPIWNFTSYHVFLSIKKNKEPDTNPLIDVLWEKGKTVVVSRSDFSTGNMEHFLLQKDTVLQLNPKGIPEPVNSESFPTSDIDVVFVPLLAFDAKGNRLGYGKGFYDRFLADCPVETLKIGLSFFEPIEAFDEVYSHDIRLDFCVTPTKVFEF